MAAGPLREVMEELAYCESELITTGAKLASGKAGKSPAVEKWLERAGEMQNEVKTARSRVRDGGADQVPALHAHIDNLMSEIWASVKTGEKLLEIGDGSYGADGTEGGSRGRGGAGGGGWKIPDEGKKIMWELAEKGFTLMCEAIARRYNIGR